MNAYDAFSSCCAAIDRLLDGANAETTPEMTEDERALAIVQAARRDFPFTWDFWQRYRLPDGSDNGGSRSEHYHAPRPDYRQGTGKDYSYRIGEGEYGKGKKGRKAQTYTQTESQADEATEFSCNPL